MLGRSSLLAQSISKSLVRSYHGGVPGENLPFSLKNRYALTLKFILFFGSGLAVPYIAVAHQLLKK